MSRNFIFTRIDLAERITVVISFHRCFSPHATKSFKLSDHRPFSSSSLPLESLLWLYHNTTSEALGIHVIRMESLVNVFNCLICHKNIMTCLNCLRDKLWVMSVSSLFLTRVIFLLWLFLQLFLLLDCCPIDSITHIQHMIIFCCFESPSVSKFSRIS